MRQVIQSLRNGATSLIEVPVPNPPRNGVVVQTTASIISAGTERMLVGFGRASWLDKARQQPDKVRQVLQKAQTDGVIATLDAVRSKLDQPIPLGYCQAGTVIAVGSDVTDLAIGDRVVTNGPHAEFVRAPRTLTARIPGPVSEEAAAFAPLGAIALQGLRLVSPTFGETIVVYGLGLIGQLAVQLGKASGCRVLGIDRDAARLALAERHGAIPILAADDQAVVQQVIDATGQVGADAVLLTLATDRNEPVHNAALMSRKRGRIVLVGVTGLQLQRDDFYKKELSLQVSCSYGPGRYDPTHEDGGVDYPLPFVRWTEGRNISAVLDAMASGTVDPRPLISHRFPIERAADAYSVVTADASALGIVLQYPESADASPRIVRRAAPLVGSPGRIGWIGTGSFSSRTLMPAFKAAGASLQSVASGAGLTAALAAAQHDAAIVERDGEAILADPSVDTVVIATRHDSHAAWVRRALAAGKHVFVEKPLALTAEDLSTVRDAAEAAGRVLCVGFNRRFAPLTMAIRHATGNRGPRAIIITVNGGMLPADHWLRNPAIGGGRIVGEGCHFIDLAAAITGHVPSTLQVAVAAGHTNVPIEDIATVSLGFPDGSTATVHYFGNGHPGWPKERVEVFAGGTVASIENWRRLRIAGEGPRLPWGGRQDKGHGSLVSAFLQAVRGSAGPPIPLDVLLAVSRCSIEAQRLARAGGGAWQAIDA